MPKIPNDSECPQGECASDCASDQEVLPYVAGLLEDIAAMCHAHGREQQAEDFEAEAARLRKALQEALDR